jgi:molybdopterin molybdotransferase
VAALLPIDAAVQRILAAVVALEPEDVAVADALHRVLAADVVAAHDVPPFANSAMDGFAVAPGPAGRRLRVVAESRAGMPAQAGPGPEEAVRISTGAAMPPGDLGVVAVEQAVEEDGGWVTVDEEVRPGRHVRGAGEDLRAGSVVLTAGTVLGPAQLGVAVAAGAAAVPCTRRARVAVVATGDELVAPGQPLGPGQIHDSNALVLAALAAREGADVVSVAHAGDDAAATRDAFAEALHGADVVIASGGVSVGPHDHVKPALEALGVEEVFWRVALRPGKPTWFGTRGRALVLGLPGNPVSAMVTFLLFARPALRALSGRPGVGVRRRAVLGESVPRHEQRDELVRVVVAGDGTVRPTGPQGSHVLSSLAAADALAIVPMGSGELAAGAEVELVEL